MMYHCDPILSYIFVNENPKYNHLWQKHYIFYYPTPPPPNKLFKHLWKCWHLWLLNNDNLNIELRELSTIITGGGFKWGWGDEQFQGQNRLCETFWLLNGVNILILCYGDTCKHGGATMCGGRGWCNHVWGGGVVQICLALWGLQREGMKN